MNRNPKSKRCPFVKAILTFLFISAFVSPIMIYADGEIVAWGELQDVPQPNTDFKAIAMGGYHAIGLQTNGSIIAWGDNSAGQCDVPAPNADFNEIAAGPWHSLGLKANGSIVAWGDNYFGQCDVPEPNTGFIAIAAGRNHSLGLKNDGSIVAWGNNYSGQCDVPYPNAGFKAVTAYAYTSLGLKECQFNLPGDENDDCKVDFRDFAIISNNWLIDCHANSSSHACVPE